MDGIQIADIFNQYPKATKVLTDWFEEGIVLTGNEEMDKHIGPMKRNPDVAVKIVLSMGTPRFLYDFFDKHGVRVSIHYDHTDPSHPFHGYVDGKSQVIGDEREGVEERTFKGAFSVLEDKIVKEEKATETEIKADTR